MLVPGHQTDLTLHPESHVQAVMFRWIYSGVCVENRFPVQIWGGITPPEFLLCILYRQLLLFLIGICTQQVFKTAYFCPKVQFCVQLNLYFKTT